MKRVLLLGAAGLLGTGIRAVFEGTDIRLTGLTRSDFDADIHGAEDRLAECGDADYLINCIAYHKVDQCEDNVEQSFKINSALVCELARYCAARDMVMIHISTDYVFDGRMQRPYVETDLPGPLNIYGASKLAGESVVRAYAPKHFILRVSSLFGDREPFDAGMNFVEKMVDAARRRKPLNVIDDQIMSPTFSHDVAEAIKAIVEKDFDQYGLYHACNSGECSWFEFARAVFDLTGLENDLTPVSYCEFHTYARRPQYCSMHNSALAQVYSMRSWNEALEDYLRRRGYLKRKD